MRYIDNCGNFVSNFSFDFNLKCSVFCLWPKLEVLGLGSVNLSVSWFLESLPSFTFLFYMHLRYSPVFLVPYFSRLARVCGFQYSGYSNTLIITLSIHTLINIVFSTNAAFFEIVMLKGSVPSEICFLLPWFFAFFNFFDENLNFKGDCVQHADCKE
jgi:hypothetical protein